MNVLRNLERTLSGLVEGTFGRVFRSEVRPVELARRLAREMDEHRTVSISRTYAPNEYVVWLSPADRGRYEGVEDEVTDELVAYLLEHAREEGLALASRPQVSFATDEALPLGEFGIETRLVRPPEEELEHAGPGHGAGGAGQADDHGSTMLFSGADRLRPDRGPAPVSPQPAARAVLLIEGTRNVVPPAGGVIGRSRECDIVLSDPNVSRRHAELRPSGGGWELIDLGSTNGTRVNHRRVDGRQRLVTGDVLELGTAEGVFEVERR
jgi:hypothetical protein